MSTIFILTFRHMTFFHTCLFVLYSDHFYLTAYLASSKVAESVANNIDPDLILYFEAFSLILVNNVSSGLFVRILKVNKSTLYWFPGSICPLPSSTLFDGMCTEECADNSNCGNGKICCFIDSCSIAGTSVGFICVPPQNKTGNVELQIIDNAVFSQFVWKQI